MSLYSNMSIRPLSSELQVIAEKELNEVPARIQQDLNHIREWISKQPHLKARTDDQWLIAFLRGCKFSLERTKERVDLHYTIKTMLPEFFNNRDPFLPEIQEILKQGPFIVLPKRAHPGAQSVLMARPGVLDADRISVTTAVKVATMFMDILLLEDDNYNVAGSYYFGDIKNVPYKVMTQITPDFLRRGALGGQETYPTRMKGFYAINTPSFLMTIYHAFKMLLNEKNKTRLFFYDEKNIDEFYKAIPRSILPKELGGEGGSCDEIAAYWKNKVESYRDWFLEDSRLGTDEKKRPGKPKTAESLLGIQGSFRKLDLD